MRKVNADTYLLDQALKLLSDKGLYYAEDFSDIIVQQFDKSPIYGLKVGEILYLNNYKIITDSNNNILIFSSGNDKRVRTLIFLYEEEVYFSGSKMMANLIEKITAINTAIEELYHCLDQNTKYMLKNILNDNYMLDSLRLRNKQRLYWMASDIQPENNLSSLDLLAVGTISVA